MKIHSQKQSNLFCQYFGKSIPSYTNTPVNPHKRQKLDYLRQKQLLSFEPNEGKEKYNKLNSEILHLNISNTGLSFK